MYFHYSGKRIRNLADGEKLWWYWDDISNAMEIPASELLAQATAKFGIEDGRYIKKADAASMIGMEATRLQQLGILGKNADVGTKRYMSIDCLIYLLEINRAKPGVKEFCEWIKTVPSIMRRLTLLYQSMAESIRACEEICKAMSHFANAMDAETQNKLIWRVMVETDIIRSALNFIDSTVQKDELTQGE
jgi:hypothetical protein